MKKSTALLVTTACALTITNNSLAMLTKASSIKQIKRIRSFYTNTPMYNNNELLHKIIQQNEQNNNLLKENNELLRAIIMQNYLSLCKEIQNNGIRNNKLDSLEKSLREKYNIQLTYKE